MTIRLGAIADDFTGATDLANTLVKQGMRVVQVIGVPDVFVDHEDADAVVIALKSRTAPVKQAVAESLRALSWLGEQGAEQIISKYCSTFDSTSDGNIGPVADALMEALEAKIAVVCPAFPANGRTVFNGYLFVGAELLSDSSMRNHPLTPMRDSSLIRLLEAQSAFEAGLVPLETVRNGEAAIKERFEALAVAGKRYAVVDALSEDDLRIIGRAVKDHSLVTGGSGIALGLPENLRAAGRIAGAVTPDAPETPGRALVLAGSCSAATRAQIAIAKAKWPARKIEADAIAAGEDVVGSMMRWALMQSDDVPVLLYASADPGEVNATQEKYGVAEAGAMIERVMAELAVGLYKAGFTRIVVAGGETSGAVVGALGVRALRIGPEIAPGIPWTEGLGGEPLALALKSGNFGGPNFFEEAFELLP